MGEGGWGLGYGPSLPREGDVTNEWGAWSERGRLEDKGIVGGEKEKGKRRRGEMLQVEGEGLGVERGGAKWGEWEMGGGKHSREQREEVLFLADKK